MMSLCEVPANTAKEMTVYLHTTSAAYSGPYAWCARIVGDCGVIEMGGASLTQHDTRLIIVGMINAFNSIKEAATIKLVCSNYEYAVKYVLGRLDPSMEGELRKRKAANLDLFPSLRLAVGRHVAVVGVEVHRDDRDVEHLLTVEGAKQLLAELQCEEAPTILQAAASATLLGDAAVPWLISGH